MSGSSTPSSPLTSHPTCASFAAGPTLQAHKGEAHSKQLLFMWKPPDLHLSFPGRACSQPAALELPRLQAARGWGLNLWGTGAGKGSEQNELIRRGKERGLGTEGICTFPHLLDTRQILWPAIQIRIWAAPVPGAGGS